METTRRFRPVCPEHVTGTQPDVFAAAKAESERRYPALNADEDILNYPRGAVRAMLRGAFQAGASWAHTRKDHQ